MATFTMSIYYLVKFYREFFRQSMTGNVNVRNSLSILSCMTPDVPLTAMENEVAKF